MHRGRASDSHDYQLSETPEAEIRASLAEPLRLLAEVTDDIFWVMDAKIGAITYVSDAYERIWKRSIPSPAGSPCEWHRWIQEEDRDAAYHAIAALRTAGRGFEIKYRIPDGAGKLRWAHDRGWPVRDQSGRVISVIGIIRDI
jgi:PAS domain-containing protein